MTVRILLNMVLMTTLKKSDNDNADDSVKGNSDDIKDKANYDVVDSVTNNDDDMSTKLIAMTIQWLSLSLCCQFQYCCFLVVVIIFSL